MYRKYRSFATYPRKAVADKKLGMWQKSHPEKDLFVVRRNNGKEKHRFSVVEVVRKGSKRCPR
tara:strand:- start:1886 stop:2074 length:189 start_codon:yes stop_codon:yes gene_type:complete